MTRPIIQYTHIRTSFNKGCSWLRVPKNTDTHKCIEGKEAIHLNVAVFLQDQQGQWNRHFWSADAKTLYIKKPKERTTRTRSTNHSLRPSQYTMCHVYSRPSQSETISWTAKRIISCQVLSFFVKRKSENICVFPYNFSCYWIYLRNQWRWNTPISFYLSFLANLNLPGNGC